MRPKLKFRWSFHFISVNGCSFLLIPFGGDEEDRTPDPLRARQVLSQLSYTPMVNGAAQLLSLHPILKGLGSVLMLSFIVKLPLQVPSKLNNNSTKLFLVLTGTFRLFLSVCSLERRWSSRTFRYGYLVTTSPQSSIPPSTASSLRLDYWLRVLPTSMVWRAVCTRPGNAFTATFWSAITSNSDFM